MEITLESSIKKVTVYPDRARVVANGRCQVTPGQHQLIFEELPLSLATESARVSGAGSAPIRLLGVDIKRRHYEVTPSQKVRDIEQQIEALGDEMQVIKDEKGALLAHAQYLDGLRKATDHYAKGLSRGKTSVTEQAQLISFLQEQESELRATLREQNKEQRDLTRRLQKLKEDLELLRMAKPRQRYRAVVEIEASGEGEFEAELSYVVGNASWRPLYDLRFELGPQPQVELTTIAQITQNTGQDWEGVTLTVSTARPALNQRLPELKPWFVDVFKPQPRPQQIRRKLMTAASAPAAATMDMMEKEEAEMAAPEPVAAEVALAEVQDSGTAVSFKIGGGSDIPSDGSPHKTTISQLTLDAKVDYLAVPKHTDAVYRRATLINSTPSPLLAGQTGLFVGDEFIGRSQINYTPVNGELELLLGVEERITIERELSKRDVDKRFLRDNRQLRYGYKITVKNLLTADAALEIHDHIPVSRHEQIKIKLEDATPSPREQTDLNLLEWKRTLAPEQTETIQYEYSVEHPRSLNVVGLMD